MRFLPYVVLAAVALALLFMLNSSGSGSTPNRAVQFVHLVVPDARCEVLYSGEGIFPDTAECIVGTTLQFCRASTVAPPSCQKILDLAPPAKKP